MTRQYKVNSVLVVSFLLFSILEIRAAGSDAGATPEVGSVIFFHPDGSSLAAWEAMRIHKYGPDAFSEWDQLERMSLYRGHLQDDLTGTSNAGAVIHAFGTIAGKASFGADDKGRVHASASGSRLSIVEEAIAQGIPTGLINSGDITEPGTAAFVAHTPNREERLEIAKKVLESGVDLIFSGGEQFLLPQGVSGRFTKADEAQRTDGLNLIELAKSKGYTVVYTKRELKKSLLKAKKILGVFAKGHSFHDLTEEDLKKAGLDLYLSSAPSIAEMMSFAIQFLSKDQKRFLLIAEEEGSDNFGNRNNASGLLESLSRADDAIKVARRFIDQNTHTLLLMASDSNAGGPQLIGLSPDTEKTASALNGSPMDGRDGAHSRPFLSARDRRGKRHQFGILWATYDDTTGGVVARAHGFRSELMPPHIWNTDFYSIMRKVLFDPGFEMTAKRP